MDDTSSYHLDHLANLLTFVVSSHKLNFNILSDGIDSALYFCLSNLGGEGNLPTNVGRCIKMPFRVLALVTSYTGIKLHSDKRWGWGGKLIDAFTFLATLCSSLAENICQEKEGK